MIIHLKKSVLFTEHPDKRFAYEHSVPKGLWNEMWKRYKLLDYRLFELCEFYHIRTGKKTNSQTIKRWIWRSEIYCLVNPIMEKGIEVVMSEFFGEYEWDVVKELTKNLRSGTEKTKAVI